MKYKITNELTGETITVSGSTIRRCQQKAKRKGWTGEDIYHSDKVERRGLFGRTKESDK